MLTCSYCGINNCKFSKTDPLPGNCPTRQESIQQQALALYEEKENHTLAYHSAMLDQSDQPTKTRVEEIIIFAKSCGYQHLGLAFCMGLLKEAKIFTDMLKANGFTVSSIICKNGGFKKEVLEIPEKQEGPSKALCNPIGQALFLNDAQTEFNIILGLCVGHDSLFIKYSEAPITVLAVKDRITGHNPLSPIYLSDSYYKRLKEPLK